MTRPMRGKGINPFRGVSRAMHTDSRSAQRRTTLACEALEDRAVPATVALAGGVLTVTGTPGDDRIRVFSDGAAIHVLDGTTDLGAFSPALVTSITVNTDGGNDSVITDRNGRILGVRVESGVDPNITGNVNNLVFAVDGAYSLALTGAYFGNNQAPLTSRTIQFISQSTITQREVNSNPNITDPNSTARGPGFVAPVGIKGHFPPGVPFTPQVDLFEIEHTNRDSSYAIGPDGILGT